MPEVDHESGEAVAITDAGKVSAAEGQVVEIRAADEINTAERVIVSSRSYVSTQHLWAARHFAHFATEHERAYANQAPMTSIQHRAYVITAVAEAVAFLEATVNEVFQDAADAHHSYVGGLGPTKIAALATYWQTLDRGMAYVLKKYTRALTDCGATPIPTTDPRYQDAAALVELRHALTHYRPASVSDVDPHPLDAKLVGRFVPNALLTYTGGKFFPEHALGAGCAQWAVDTVTAFSGHFAQGLGLTLNYQQVKWLAEPPDSFLLPESTAPLSRRPRPNA